MGRGKGRKIGRALLSIARENVNKMRSPKIEGIFGDSRYKSAHEFLEDYEGNKYSQMDDPSSMLFSPQRVWRSRCLTFDCNESKKRFDENNDSKTLMSSRGSWLENRTLPIWDAAILCYENKKNAHESDGYFLSVLKSRKFFLWIHCLWAAISVTTNHRWSTRMDLLRPLSVDSM